MSQNYYHQYLAQLGAPHRIVSVSGQTEHPQPHPQPVARLNGTAAQNSRSMARQSRQVYPVQTQPQLQSSQVAGTSTLHDTRHNDPNIVLNHFLSQLCDQQRHINDSLAKSDKCLEALISSVSSIRETVDGLTNKLEAHDRVFEKLEQSAFGDNNTKAKEIDVMKVLVGEMKSFKKTLGKSCDGDDGRTVLGRLDAVTFTVGELLERARDPEANLLQPSAPTTVVPPIIDLTTSPSPGPPPVRCTPPFQSHTYADVGTSPVPPYPPLKEKHFASIQVGTSPRPSSDPFESLFQSPVEESTPYSGRFPSPHTLVDDTTTSPDIGFTALARETLESAASTPMHVNLVDPTNPTPDSQICSSSTTGTNDSEDATRIQIESQLSDNAPATTEEGPHVENIHTTVHPVMHSGLVSPNGAQTSLNVTPGLESDIPTFEQPYISASASTSGASPASPTIPFTQIDAKGQADKTAAAFRASTARFMDSDLGIAISSVREGKKKEQSLEPLESPRSSRDRETLSTDNMNSEESTASRDGRGHNEEKIRASKRDKEEGRNTNEEIKRIEKQGFEFNRNRADDVPVPAPGLIDLSQHLRGRPRSSSSCFASPSMSLTSLSIRGIGGSALSVDPSENVSIFSRSSNTKLHSPTRTKVSAGASRSPGSVFRVTAAPAATPAGASPIGAIVSTGSSTKIPLATSTGEAASVDSSQLVLQPTVANAELATSPTSTTTSPVIETLLLRSLSPLSDVESDMETEKGVAKETNSGQISEDFLKKRDTSLGEDADIVRIYKKQKISEEPHIVKHGLASERAGLMAKGGLKIGNKGESVAITRIKKRRAVSGFINDDDELDQERPLTRARQRGSGYIIDDDELERERPSKRARQRVSGLEKGKGLTREFSGSSSRAESSTGVMKPRSSAPMLAKDKKESSPSKTRLSARGRGKFEVEWPKMIQGDRTEDLVECNKCQAWYHYGCVGITADDTRLHDGKKKYLCPPCEAGVVLTKLTTDTDCWRPGCVVPAGFIVEKIIGRFKKYVDGEEIQFRYLLRWKGYKLSESTWEPEESMYDPPFMIDKFRVDALEEGIDIDKDKTGLVLLRVARHPCVPKPT